MVLFENDSRLGRLHVLVMRLTLRRREGIEFAPLRDGFVCSRALSSSTVLYTHVMIPSSVGAARSAAWPLIYVDRRQAGTPRSVNARRTASSSAPVIRVVRARAPSGKRVWM